VRPVVKLQIVKLQIARHGAGAQKTGGISEARNNGNNENDEMAYARIRTRHDHVLGRLRKEGRPAAAPPPTRTHRSPSLVVGESA